MGVGKLGKDSAQIGRFEFEWDGLSLAAFVY